MIPFFRKIRKKMADDNKPLKYMRYAFGEVILVVIGILIALQINNWNEKQKIVKEETGILNNLLENLHRAHEQSDNYIIKDKNLKQSLLVALDKKSNQTEINSNTISDSLFYQILWDIESSVPILNSYSDIKSSGKVGIIKNSRIRESFTNLEISLNDLKLLVDDRLTVQQIRVDDIAVNDVNFVRLLKPMEPSINIAKELTNDYDILLTNQKIRNLLAIKFALTKDVIDKRVSLGDEISDLIILLETELKNRRQ